MTGDDESHEEDTRNCHWNNEPPLVDSTYPVDLSKWMMFGGKAAHGGGGTTFDAPALVDMIDAMKHPAEAVGCNTSHCHMTEHVDCYCEVSNVAKMTFES